MELSAIAATSTQSSAASRLNANFDTFLTLLTTQLRNQDPLEPLDTEKFTEQLVQFSQVEQSIQTNTHLEALLALQAAGARDSAIGLVGRIATIESAAAANAGAGATWTYTLPSDASSVALAIVDSSGRVAASLEGASAEGAHSVVWNGLRDDGTKAPEGVYRLVVGARSENGANITARIETTLRVDAVSFAGGTPLLETAAGAAPLTAVTRVAAQS